MSPAKQDSTDSALQEHPSSDLHPALLLRQHCATLCTRARIPNSTARTTYGVHLLSCCRGAPCRPACQHSPTLLQVPPATCHLPPAWRAGRLGPSRGAQMPAGLLSNNNTVATVAQTAPVYTLSHCCHRTAVTAQAWPLCDSSPTTHSCCKTLPQSKQHKH